MGRKIGIFILLLAVLSTNSFGQSVGELIAVGDSLHRRYFFNEAQEVYFSALQQAQDDTLDNIHEIQKKMLYSENGVNMALFADSPVVISKRKFSKDDFFLYYPLPDSSWRHLPNQLDSVDTQWQKAMYFPADADKVYYPSATSANSTAKSIFQIERKDSLWTSPLPVEIRLPASLDVVFPMLSPSGKELYFSSDGLYGVGGYDIYVSRWDEENLAWSDPVNMGFPYSSPADDFLYVSSSDREHTFFASNRECSPDSVWVYVLEYNNMPVRKEVSDPQELLELSRLEPSGYMESMSRSEDENSIPENVDTRKYLDKITEVKALRDTISLYNDRLDKERNKYAMSNDEDERLRLTTEILKKEEALPKYQDSLDVAMTQLQKIEMEFLFKGVVIDPDKLMAQADDEGDDNLKEYSFVKKSFGPSFNLKFEPPVLPQEDSLSVLPVGKIFVQDSAPQDLTYQIALCSSPSKLSRMQVRGLYPVFEVLENSTYKYMAGRFSTYAKAQEALLLVEAQGFAEAEIIAYSQGKLINIETAKKQEKKKQ